MAASARHETRALLRAHLSAASGYRHLTRHCAICHRLLRLAMEPAPYGEDDAEALEDAGDLEDLEDREDLQGLVVAAADEATAGFQLP
ncbi:DUF6274 family protein [Streptomyces sp. NPDC005808]|uniref:DUF6274 family protein n=1 Tax=Streptomyces sp. NPDC005808 TaxID=3364734 RepID=UPI003698057D